MLYSTKFVRKSDGNTYFVQWSKRGNAVIFYVVVRSTTSYNGVLRGGILPLTPVSLSRSPTVKIGYRRGVFHVRVSWVAAVISGFLAFFRTCECE